MRHVGLGPETPQQGGSFLQPAAALLDRQAEGSELLGRVSRPDPQDEAATRDHVHHGPLLGHAHGMIEGQQQHTRSQRHPAGAGGDGGQPQERCRIEDRIVVVLAEPDRIEPRGFRPFAFPDGFVEAPSALQRAQSQFHHLSRWLPSTFPCRRSSLAKAPSAL